VLDELMKDEKLSQQTSAMEGMQDLRVLLQYCEIYKISDKVQIYTIHNVVTSTIRY